MAADHSFSLLVFICLFYLLVEPQSPRRTTSKARPMEGNQVEMALDYLRIAGR
jgi:hypothetical protein